MRLFLADNGVDYSYMDFLFDVNAANQYRPLYQTDSLYAYFLNLIVALISDQPLTLVDSDMSENEVMGLGMGELNSVVTIEHTPYDNMPALIDKVLRSSSEITIFTSGTTGQPKKVVHTIQTLTRTVRKSEKYSDNKWLFAYNPTHMAGLQVFFQAFCNENTLVNVFNHDRTVVFKALEDYQITHISATPTFYRLLMPADRIFPDVQRVTLGGEKSSATLYDNISKLFPNARLNNIYASTEAGSLFAAKGENFQIPQEHKDKFKISGENELLIHKSLLGFSDSFVYSDDFYHTNDLVEWVNREEGIFRFLSRKNELINVGGYKVNPNEVENCMYQIPGIEQVMVYGKSNSILGNILCADVCLVDGCELKELQIREYLSGKLQDFKIPRRIKFVEQIHLTRTGKLKRQ